MADSRTFTHRPALDSRGLQDSFGPEVTPYQRIEQQPFEVYSEPPCFDRIAKEAPEVVQHPAGEPPLTTTRQPPRRKVLLFAIPAVLVILGVALGLGLGLGLKRGGATAPPTSSASPTSHIPSRSQSSSTSASPTSAAPSAPVVTSGTHGLAANSCTFQTPRTHLASQDTRFTQYCFTDWPNGSEAADGKGRVRDLRRATVYTFEACMDECVAYNRGVARGAPTCQAVTYNSNLTSIIEEGRQGGNCFLKNKKAVNIQGSAESASAAIAL
ncbi:hypothetical protein HIM_06069 [Hirsutella minnesotensis 3608]|uniref:Apple domain-containing protein n=1 Tax=Hirsutella minnesotensis 3608 TaxID=1043627 RepID=A0A0F7ZU95_9HYPO|nr:hypothetical protein HIM_06069 [Hirsutella minnesotensis 3608]